MATELVERPRVTAQVKFVRMSASKVRLVLNQVRGKKINDALHILELSDRLAAKNIIKCLSSAVANAEHNEDLSSDDLFLSDCFADEGPTLKRFRPRARGRAGRIHKQTCHISMTVSRFTDEELETMGDSEQKSQASKSSKKSKSNKSAPSRKSRVASSKASNDKSEKTDKTVDEENSVADLDSDNVKSVTEDVAAESVKENSETPNEETIIESEDIETTDEVDEEETK